MSLRLPIPGLTLPLSLAAPWNRAVHCAGSPFIWVVCLAVLVRGAVGVVSMDRLESDPDAYRAIAQTLGQHGVFGLTTPSGEVVSTAFRPPLYPYLLSWAASDGSLNNLCITILHSILGGLTAGLTYLASAAWPGPDRGRLRGILAALLVIVDPILIQQSTLVMTETLAAALSSVVIWWWVCHVSNRLTMVTAAVLGGWLSLAYLCRPTFVLWAAMLVVCLGLSNVPADVSRFRRFGAAGVTGLVVVVVISLWTFRNAAVLGHPIWATSHGGYTLLLGNNPLIYQHFREQGPLRRWDPQAFLVAYAHRYEADPRTEDYWFRDWNMPVRIQPELSAALTEHDDDQLTYQAARATISRDRTMFLASCLIRVYKLWTPFPLKTEERSIAQVLAIGGYYSLLYLAAFVGLLRLGRDRLGRDRLGRDRLGRDRQGRDRRSVWWPIPTLVLTLTLVHAVYWSNSRMRAPAIPAIAMLAAAAFYKPERAGV